jgi:hypothetical protein
MQLPRVHASSETGPAPDDIGGVVVFLASEEARWITGDIIRGGAD